MNRLRYLLVLLFLICFGLITPSIAQSDEDRALARDLVDIADEILRSTRAVEQALENYETAASLDPDNIKANYLAGKYRLSTIHKDLALPYFNKVKILDANYRFDIDYLIAESYHFGLEFDMAIDHYKLYLKRLKQQPLYREDGYVSKLIVDRKIHECENGKVYVANPVNKSIINLGSRINSQYDDFAPVFNEDESIIVFTSRRLEGNLNSDVDMDNKPFEDIFFSQKNGENWGDAKNLGSDINTPYHDSNLSMSSDGNLLYIYMGDVGNGDIYFSRKNPDTKVWTSPVPLPDRINKRESTESSLTISPDGNVIIFASNMEGGSGDFDLYFSAITRKGDWSFPRNLGTTVNTEFSEDGPFLDHDGKTLYFSSEGHEGMGGYDIYKTVYDSIRNEWSIPENLGYPINSADNDIYYMTSRDGLSAYYASVKPEGYGFTDIYKIVDTIEEEPVDTLVEEPILTVANTLELSVIDKNTGVPLAANAKLLNLVTNKDVPLEESSVGRFVWKTDNKEITSFMVDLEMEGYLYETVTIRMPAVKEKSVVVRRITTLEKMQINTIKVLRNLYFESGKAQLKPESYPELDKFTNMMKANPSLLVEISGHTDNVGDPAFNKELSRKRAEAVQNYLVEHGIDPDKLTAVGYGEEQPLVSNDDEDEGREINRRVEFKILK